MAKCLECSFLLRVDSKTYACSIEKVKHPGRPEYYIKDENSISCMSNYRKIIKDKKNSND